MSLAVLIVVAAAVAFVWWRLSVWLYPNRTACWLCKGKGRLPGSRQNRWRVCPACKGKPKLRRGARERR